MVDILDLEYASKGRDVDISEPILSYLELKYSLKIIRKCCFKNWLYYLIKYKPKMVFIANGVGSIPHFNIVKTAHFLGIKVVTHISEGDYKESHDGTLLFFWGFNTDQILYEDLHLEWSQRNIDLIEKHVGHFNKIQLTGAVGFDKYKLLTSLYLKKDTFLNKYSKNSYKKIIGIAGWGFDLFVKDYYDPSNNHNYESYTKQEISNIQKSKDLVLNILKLTIEKKQDILFVLKHHPLVNDKLYSEFHGLSEFPNVLVLQTEETIYDLINVCDMWGAYESTTTMEAWLIGNKPTFVFQPIENDFNRSKIADGSPQIRTSEEFQVFVDEYFETGKVDSFEQLESKRQEIITKVIQWSDGKNHQRAAEYIYELYKSPLDKKTRINLYILRIYFRYFNKKCIKQIRKLLKLPIYRDDRFNDKEREEWHQIYLKAVKDFHQEKYIDENKESLS